jgi:transforming growth factor-beta-induced protein
LTVLSAAFVHVGLADALSQKLYNLTLFAPSDEAFDKIPAVLLNTLLTNNGLIPHLDDLLSYHVRFAEAAIFAIDLSDNLLVRIKNGEDLLITLSPIAVNGNKVDAADIGVSNGVIHIIDGVLLPTWVRNSIANRVVADSDLYTFSLVVMAGLVDAFAGSGELTLADPINSAFAKLSETVLDLLTSAEGRDF